MSTFASKAKLLAGGVLTGLICVPLTAETTAQQKCVPARFLLEPGRVAHVPTATSSRFPAGQVPSATIQPIPYVPNGTGRASRPIGSPTSAIRT